MLKKNLLLFIFYFCICLKIVALKFITVQDGYWSDSSTWQGFAIPKFSDTIIIRHYVIFTDDIVIPSIGYIQIDSSGTLCGQKCFTQKCGSLFYNYGFLHADSVLITDGSNLGAIYALTDFGVSPCLMDRSTGPFEVGATLSCELPLSGIKQEYPGTNFNVFPNPFISSFKISGLNGNQHNINLYNQIGKLIYQNRYITNNQEIDVSGYSPGIYFIEIRDELNGKIGRKKLVKE
jgi:hypothetical protein